MSRAEPQTLFVDPASGARTTLRELEGEVDVERHTFETVLGIYADEGFYRNLRSERIYGVGPHLDTRPSEVLLIGVKGPRRGLERSELSEKYERVDGDEARPQPRVATDLRVGRGSGMHENARDGIPAVSHSQRRHLPNLRQNHGLLRHPQRQNRPCNAG